VVAHQMLPFLDRQRVPVVIAGATIWKVFYAANRGGREAGSNHSEKRARPKIAIKLADTIPPPGCMRSSLELWTRDTEARVLPKQLRFCQGNCAIE
jgi:hypothetical protein